MISVQTGPSQDPSCQRAQDIFRGRNPQAACGAMSARSSSCASGSLARRNAFRDPHY